MNKKRIIKEEKRKEIKKSQAMNILVVDDGEEIYKMFIKCLSAEEHKVKVVLGGKNAIELVKDEYFNVVFLDIVMSGIPATKVHEKIKEISPKTKVAMITSKLMDSNLLQELKQKPLQGFS